MSLFYWSWLLVFAPVVGAFVYMANMNAGEVPWVWEQYGMAAHYPVVLALMATALVGLFMILIVLGGLQYHLFRDQCDRCSVYRIVISEAHIGEGR